jgi:Anti-sigma-K factor rskA/Putative zinc-finger
MDEKHRRTTELLEAFALGALDEDERREVEAHLEQCDECAQLARALAEVAHGLPLALAATSPLRPPPSLKERVLGSIAPAALQVARQGPPRTRRSWWPRAALAVGLAAIVALFGAWTARLNAALSEERSLRERLAEIVDQRELVLEVVDSRHTVKRVLVPPPTRTSASYGKVFTRSDMPHVVAMVGRLPQPRPGHAYHLWLTSRGRTRLVGLITPNRDGFALLLFKAKQQPPLFERVEIGLQRRGSPRPANVVLSWR